MRISVLGNGNIGKCVAKNLREAHEVVVGDITGKDCDIVNTSDTIGMRQWLSKSQAVVCCLPYHSCLQVAKVAAELGIAYFDLTEDVHSTEEIKKFKTEASMVPQCGLAPGAVSVIAKMMCGHFQKVKSLQIRVGALPKYPNNQIKYYLTWSTAGLINEYCNPCDTIIGGVKKKVQPLEGYEEISIDGTSYEAFNTSGGLGTLCDSMEGLVDHLDYKTIRHKGHHDKMLFLLRDLNLSNRKDFFTQLFDQEVPRTTDDVVIVFVKAVGEIDGVLTEKTYVKHIHGQDGMSAIQRSTSYGVCAAVQVWSDGGLKPGFVSQEEIPWDSFSGNHWGSLYSR